jgi:hypothetical protein
MAMLANVPYDVILSKRPHWTCFPSRGNTPLFSLFGRLELSVVGHHPNCRREAMSVEEFLGDGSKRKSSVGEGRILWRIGNFVLGWVGRVGNDETDFRF